MKLTTKNNILLAGLLACALPVCALEIGEPLVDGDVQMEGVDGKMVTLNGLKGEKGTLVIFSCNHCPVAKAWQETMTEIGNAYQTKGFGVVFINSNDPVAYKEDGLEGMKEMAKAKGYEFPYVVDATSDIARHFGATKTPDVFLFDANGNLAYKGAVGEGGRGPQDGGTTYLKNAMDALLAGESVPTPETKSVGCSIKYR